MDKRNQPQAVDHGDHSIQQTADVANQQIKMKHILQSLMPFYLVYLVDREGDVWSFLPSGGLDAEQATDFHPEVVYSTVTALPKFTKAGMQNLLKNLETNADSWNSYFESVEPCTRKVIRVGMSPTELSITDKFQLVVEES